MSEDWLEINEETPRMKTIIMWGETGWLGTKRNWVMASGHIHVYEGVGPEEIIWEGRNLQEWDYKPTHWKPMPNPPSHQPLNQTE